MSSIAASLEGTNKIQEEDAPRRQKELGLKEKEVKLKEAEVGLKTRNEEIKWMREKIVLLKEVGTEDEVAKAKRQLLDIYDKPLSHCVVDREGGEQGSKCEIGVNGNDSTGSHKAGDGSPADVTGGTSCDGFSNTSALFALASVGEALTNGEITSPAFCSPLVKASPTEANANKAEVLEKPSHDVPPVTSAGDPSPALSDPVESLPLTPISHLLPCSPPSRSTTQ